MAPRVIVRAGSGDNIAVVRPRFVPVVLCLAAAAVVAGCTDDEAAGRELEPTPGEDRAEPSATTFAPVSTTIAIPSGHTEMLLPAYHGVLRQIGSYQARYPSAAHNMQFVAFRNPTTGSVFYVQTTDPDGQIIDWKIESAAPGYRVRISVFSTTAAFPSGLVVTDATSITAPTQEAFYRNVARRYKAWAAQQKWAKRRTSPLDDIATMQVLPDLRAVTLDTYAAPVADAFDGQRTACWDIYWRKTWRWGLDGLTPDYRLGGGQASLDGLAWLDAHACDAFPYTNALLWDSALVHTDNPATDLQIAGNEAVAANPNVRYRPELMVKDAQGHVASAPESNCSASTPGGCERKKYVCQHTSAWQDVFHAGMQDVAADGWSGIYYDMAAFSPPQPCYATDHGHAIADPLAWQNGIRSILTTLRSDPETSDLAVFTEGNAEIYLDLVDGFLSYAETAQPDSTSPLRRQVPLFASVYGEFTRMLGWQLFAPPVGGQPSKTIADLTPAALAKASKRAADFGSLAYTAPAFFGWSANRDVLVALADDPAYAQLRDLLTLPPHRRVFEPGGGAASWRTVGSVAAPTTVVDAETGTAAVRFTRGPNNAHHELVLDDTTATQLSWDQKLTGNFFIDVTVQASDGKPYYLVYDAHSAAWRDHAGSYVKVGLGANSKDGNWHTIRRDLDADLRSAYPDLHVTRVDRFMVFAEGSIDEVALHDGGTIVEDGSGAGQWQASASGLTATSAVDPERASSVVRFAGATNRDQLKYHARSFANSKQYELSWDMATSHPYYVLVVVSDDGGHWYHLLYDHNARDFRMAVGSTLKFGLGADTKDGTWHSFRRNLADDLFEATGRDIGSVIEMRVYAVDAIDDVRLAGTGFRSAAGR